MAAKGGIGLAEQLFRAPCRRGRRNERSGNGRGLMDSLQRAADHADYTALQQVTAQLEAALGGPAATTGSHGRALRRKADRNAACALAAGRGVRVAALNRLTEIRQAAAELVTYDENGKRTGLGAVSGCTAVLQGFASNPTPSGCRIGNS